MEVTGHDTVIEQMKLRRAMFPDFTAVPLEQALEEFADVQTTATLIDILYKKGVLTQADILELLPGHYRVDDESGAPG
jgi:hypothetical protein